MNLLAHIYLSGQNDEVRIGNFIGDYVKGHRYRRYSPEIKKGILLHRSIDTFTDHHPLPPAVKKLLRPYYHKHAGIVVDVFYDHFLANNWYFYSHRDLAEYISCFYRTLENNLYRLPSSVQRFVPVMIRKNRILSYRWMSGIEAALQVMARHTSLPEKTPYAMEVLNHHYELINRNFQAFFPQIIEHVVERYKVDVEYYKSWSH